MSTVIKRGSTCRGCYSKSLDLIFSLMPSPIGDAFVSAEKISILQPSYPLDLFMCSNCGLAQLLDVIDPNVLYANYIYVTASSLGLADHFSSYAGSVVSKCQLKAGSLVVDVGSNDGTLLRKFQEAGMNVLGIEPAAHIAEEATKNGLKTIGDYFSPALAKRLVSEFGHAKIITANNVLANIDDLESFFNAVDVLLADDGVFVVESSYLPDLLQNLIFDFIYHEHISSFSLKPMQALSRRVGMEVKVLEHVGTKGGSIRYLIQRPGGPLKYDLSIEKYMRLEEEVGLYRKKTYQVFDDRVNALKRQTQSFLAEQKSQGKSIAGFGASITGTTMIYHFEIGSYIDYLVDDNPAKQGRYSPGLHLPVYPTSVLTERKPDYVVALAWRYSDTFLQKQRAYIEGGGALIIPVPEFKIIKN